MSLEDFVYIVHKSLPDNELGNRVLHKFDENVEFIEMITNENTKHSNSTIDKPSTLTISNVTTNTIDSSTESSPFTPLTPFTPLSSSTYEELNKEIKRNNDSLERLHSIEKENVSELEKLIDENRYLLDQKSKHLKSVLDIAKNTPISDLDTNNLHKDIESLSKKIKLLVERSKKI